MYIQCKLQCDTPLSFDCINRNSTDNDSFSTQSIYFVLFSHFL